MPLTVTGGSDDRWRQSMRSRCKCWYVVFADHMWPRRKRFRAGWRGLLRGPQKPRLIRNMRVRTHQPHVTKPVLMPCRAQRGQQWLGRQPAESRARFSNSRSLFRTARCRLRLVDGLLRLHPVRTQASACRGVGRRAPRRPSHQCDIFVRLPSYFLTQVGHAPG